MARNIIKASGKKRHLSFRIFWSFSILLVALLILTYVIVAVPVFNIINRDRIHDNLRDMALISNMTREAFDYISNYAISLSTNSRVISLLKSYPHGFPDAKNTIALRGAIGSNMQTILGSNSGIYMYDVLTLTGEPFGISGYDVTRITRQLPDNFFEQSKDNLACKLSGVYNIELGTRKIPVFLLTKLIVDLDSHEPYGFLVFVVKETFFTNFFTSNVPLSDMTILLLDEKMCIAYSSDKSLLSKDLAEAYDLRDEDYIKLTQTRQLVNHSDSSHGEQLLMLSKPISKRIRWRVLISSDLGAYFSVWRNILLKLLLISSAGCVLLIFIASRISHSISKPINTLATEIMSTIEEEHLHQIDNPGGGTEVEALYNSYNKLISQLQGLIAKIAYEQEEKTIYRFRLLQAQMKPHFLYNTLMTIKSLIEIEMYEEASRCVDALSVFYRLSLSNGDDVLPLRDELRLSEKYMLIQELRYRDKICFVHEIPNTLLDYSIPKLTLQPLLENAIYHGAKEKPGKSIIRLSAKDVGEEIYIQVLDNGIGISQDKLKELNSHMRIYPDEKSPETFGLYSVNRRIQLLFGNQFGLRITSCEHKYTEVTIVIPKLLFFRYEGTKLLC